MEILRVEGLTVRAGGTDILQGIDLAVGPGEVHALMGPNGSGKSTLAAVLAGREGYEVQSGRVTYLGEDLLALEPEVRARRGLFLAFQYPVEIPGVSDTSFLKAALNAVRAERGEPPLDAADMREILERKLSELGMDRALLERPVNVGFSGGEKKRNEVLQLALLEPRLAILDETDSGLDVDALGWVARVVESLRAADRAMILVTHYRRLLEHVRPDRVHVLVRGRIARSGGPELADEIEARGFGWLGQDVEPRPIPRGRRLNVVDERGFEP